MSENEERLRRQVRAMGAVNRQLQALLDSGGTRAWTTPAGPGGGDLLANGTTGLSGSSAGARRVSVAAPWLEQLAAGVEGPEPFLVQARNGKTFLIEGGYQREVRSGLLVAALEKMLGRRRNVPDHEFDRWTGGVPVEVLEGPQGPPFVVVGGRRLPLRGLPLPYPVSADQMKLFRTGPELNLAAANMSRVQLERAIYGAYQMDRLRAAVARRGVLGTAKEAASRSVRRVRRIASRAKR
jgi:hypothetical protein